MSIVKAGINKYKYSKAIQSGVWVIGGLFASQAMRLVSNLILTRLLMPEYFGLMAIVTSTMVIFMLVSDIGLNKAVINSDRTNETIYLNTAWTLQIIQSFVVAALVVIAAYPMSIIYKEPILFPMVAVVGITVAFDGFRSIAFILYEKELRQETKVLVELGSQVLGTVLMIIAAYYFRSVWALLLGHVATTMLKTIASYLFFSPHARGFALEGKAVKEIIHFGKWIFISSLFGILSSQADVLLMGLWLTMEELGKYAIAAIFARVITMIAGRVSVKVLHPHYRKIIDQVGYIEKLHKIRTKLNLIYISMCAFTAIFGDLIVRSLYDERYHEAGWMLQFLALGKFGHCLTVTLRPLLFAKGDSFGTMLHQIVVTISLAAGMIVGAYFKGAVGLIFAYAFIPVLCHPVIVFSARKHGFYCAKRDAALVVVGAAVVVSGWILMQSPTIAVLLG